jgi:hypothetical protein
MNANTRTLSVRAKAASLGLAVAAALLSGPAWAGPPIQSFDKLLLADPSAVSKAKPPIQFFDKLLLADPSAIGKGSPPPSGGGPKPPQNQWWNTKGGQAFLEGAGNWLNSAQYGPNIDPGFYGNYGAYPGYDDSSGYDPPPSNPPPAAIPPIRGIALVSHDSTGVPIRFLVDGQLLALVPGARMELEPRPRVIAFDRGGSFGPAQYSLGEGVYTFTPTSHGFELYRRPYTMAQPQAVAQPVAAAVQLPANPAPAAASAQ